MFGSEEIEVILIEDEEFDVRRVQNTIRPFIDQIKISNIVSNGRDALDLLSRPQSKTDIVIMDFQIAGGLMGEALIERIKEIDDAIQIIVITKMTINITDYNFAQRLLKAGAFWYCTKYPGDIEDYIYQPTDFIMSIFNAYVKCRLERERRRSKQKLLKGAQDILKQKIIIGEHPLTVKLKEDIARYSASQVSVVIRGASGTGKELVAYNIHYRSSRKLENFVPINCGNLPHDLIESELFGYEKGAFTGADKRKPGLFEIANNGTIFLDEFTDLPLPSQVKLLRVLQEGEIEKLGRTDKIKVDVRVIAATNKNIEEEVRNKRLREDLYYRLNVVSISVPELKQRISDIPFLVNYFIDTIAVDMGREKPVLQDEAMNFLKAYPWHGNVRELKNVVQRFFFVDEKIINLNQAKIAVGAFNLYSDENTQINGVEFPPVSDLAPLRHIEKAVREKYFKYVRENSSSDADAASKLGLAPPNYYRMAKELGLK